MKMNKKTIGLIGCGNIGSILSGYVGKEMASCVEKMVLYDQDADKVKALAKKMPSSEIAGSIDEVVAKSALIIEAASAGAVAEVLKAAVDKGKDVMTISIGGVLDNQPLLEEARQKGIKVMMPSGAISGVDALKAASVAGIESATITTHKSPKSIKGAPYLAEKGIDVDAIEEEEVVFEGSAREAIKGFPKNVNVSSLLSLAGIGPDRTKVKIIVSPAYTKNIHEIKIVSKAGTITTRTENVPSPDNPKTSYLAPLAVIATLKDYFDNVRIGT